MNNIFLIGFMGSGKSTVARELSKCLDMELIEMDETIEANQKMSINKIFEIFGEEHFRDIEGALVEELSSRGGCVVSCGGGVVLRNKNVETMKKNGKIIMLDAAAETILERVKDSDTRPILKGRMNIEAITELMNKRRSLYENACDAKIQTDNRTVEDICKEIAALL